MDRRAQMGEGIIMMYRLFLVSLVAFAVFGVSSFSYAHHVNVRDAEAMILTREVSSCLAPEGVLNLDGISEADYGRILSYCGIVNSERFYVGVDVLDSSGDHLARLYQGDSGALWVKELFGAVALKGNSFLGENKVDVENIEKFNPGYFNSTYPVFVVKNGDKIGGNIEVEALVNYEK